MLLVALFVSAWIEIPLMMWSTSFFAVALFVSAWIEIPLKIIKKTNVMVALFVSAWIEIAIGGGIGLWFGGSHSL